MSKPVHHDLTELLIAWNAGDPSALELLAPLVDAELRRLAHHYLSRERAGHVLQTTALVNEAYVRLINWRAVRWQNRAHFFAVSAQMMRRILVDLARKRPRDAFGEARQVSLDAALVLAHEQPSVDLVALDDALTRLATRDARKSQIVELRFFGGLSVEETAEVLQVAPVTVMREWAKAKAWLYSEMSQVEEG